MGGIAIDERLNEIIAGGLSMSHSLRWVENKLWVANSGAGKFGFIDTNSGRFEAITLCLGYFRGSVFNLRKLVHAQLSGKHS